MKNFQDEGVPESFEWEGDEMAPGSLTSLFTTENKKLTKFIESLVSQSLSKTLISSEVPLQSHSNFLIPDNPDLKTFIEELSESIPQSTLVVSPRQIGHMTSLLPAHTSTISSMITSLNQNMVKIETSASLTSLEKKVMENLAKEWGMDEGLVCSGGTVANLTALWMARGMFYQHHYLLIIRTCISIKLIFIHVFLLQSYVNH